MSGKARVKLRDLPTVEKSATGIAVSMRLLKVASRKVGRACYAVRPAAA